MEQAGILLHAYKRMTYGLGMRYVYSNMMNVNCVPCLKNITFSYEAFMTTSGLVFEQISWH